MPSGARRLVLDGDPRGYLFFRVPGRTGLDSVQLFVEGAAGRFALETSALVRQDCTPGSCVSLTLPPGALPDSTERLIVSAPSIGHEARTPIATEALGPYALAAEATNANTTVTAFVDDPIRRRFGVPERVATTSGTEDVLLFPRAFDVLASRGPCGPPPTTGWVRAAGSPLTIAAPYPSGADPRVCLLVRPSIPTGGAAVIATSVPARAVVETFEHVYSPPVETAPLAFIPFFDVDLPDEDRCAAVEGLISSSVGDAAQAIAADPAIGAKVLAIDGVHLAQEDGVPCRQGNDRAFSDGAVARAIDAAIDRAIGPGARARVLVVYAENLALPPPAGLTASFAALAARFPPGSSRQIALFAIAPHAAVDPWMPDAAIDFGASEEPDFRRAIVAALEQQVWPFRTLVHTPETRVPLASAADRGRFPWYKVCEASTAIRPVGAVERSGIAAPPDGPAYTADLPPEVLLPPPLFLVPSVQVRWQGCARLCDHPAPGGDPDTPWLDVPSC